MHNCPCSPDRVNTGKWPPSQPPPGATDPPAGQRGPPAKHFARVGRAPTSFPTGYATGPAGVGGLIEAPGPAPRDGTFLRSCGADPSHAEWRDRCHRRVGAALIGGSPSRLSSCLASNPSLGQPQRGSNGGLGRIRMKQKYAYSTRPGGTL